MGKALPVSEQLRNVRAGLPRNGPPPVTLPRRGNDPVLPPDWLVPTPEELARVPVELLEFYVSDAAAPSASMLGSLARGVRESFDVIDPDGLDDEGLHAARNRPPEPVDPREVVHQYRLARARHLRAVEMSRTSRTCVCGASGANCQAAGALLCAACAAAVRRAQDRAADAVLLPDGRTRGALADELLKAVRP